MTRPRCLESFPSRSHLERSRLAVNGLMSERELSCSLVISISTPVGCTSPASVARCSRARLGSSFYGPKPARPLG